MLLKSVDDDDDDDDDDDGLERKRSTISVVSSTADMRRHLTLVRHWLVPMDTTMSHQNRRKERREGMRHISLQILTNRIHAGILSTSSGLCDSTDFVYSFISLELELDHDRLG